MRASLAFAGGAALLLALVAWRHPVIRNVRALPKPESADDQLGIEATVRAVPKTEQGSVWLGRRLELTDELVILRETALGVCRIPLHELAELRRRN